MVRDGPQEVYTRLFCPVIPPLEELRSFRLNELPNSSLMRSN